MAHPAEIEIWHARELSFGLGPRPLWPEGFRKVATVKGGCLGVAYACTRHSNGPWWENTGVTLLVPRKGVRSTAVGDVAVLHGAPYRYEASGWVILPS